MAGFVITESSTLLCPHSTGTARALLTNPRVKIAGSPIMTVQLPYQVDHCGNTNAPCVSASWMIGAARVTAGGLSVAINTGTSEVKPVGMLASLVVQGQVSAS
jgi:hypothetical protein